MTPAAFLWPAGGATALAAGTLSGCPAAVPQRPIRSDDADPLRLRALRALGDVELDALVLVKTAEPA